MENKQIAQEIANFGVTKSFVGPENIRTGLLTRKTYNPLTKEQILEISIDTEHILQEFVIQIEKVANGKQISDTECGTIFQYVFDKVTEATYKTIMEQEIDTTFDLREAFDYHEPDLPYYIQQKLTNVVSQIASLGYDLLVYIKEKQFYALSLNTWFLPYLLVPAYIGIQFAQEMNLDDDSELQAFINGND